MTLPEQLAALDERYEALLAEHQAAVEQRDWDRSRTFIPRLEALCAERELLEIALLGREEALRIRYERDLKGKTEMVASLRATLQSAVDESNWDLVAGLAPILRDATKRLASLRAPRALRLVHDVDRPAVGTTEGEHADSPSEA